MNFPYGRPKWVDGPYAQVRPVSAPVFSAPLPNNTSRYLLKQKFQQFQNNKAPCPFNARHPNFPTYILVAESEEIDIGGGVVEWQRTYASVPSSFSEYETFGYTFIGGIFVTASPPTTWPTLFIRQPTPKRCQSRIQYDFFLVNSTLTPTSDYYGLPGGPGGNLTPDGNAQVAGPGTTVNPYNDVGSIPFTYSTMYASQAYLSAAWFGGTQWIATQLTATTQPTATQYMKMVVDAQQNKWNATVTVQVLKNLSTTQQIIVPIAGDPGDPGAPNSVYGGQIPCEDSNTQRWMGNIWMRRTRFVLAQ